MKDVPSLQQSDCSESFVDERWDLQMWTAQMCMSTLCIYVGLLVSADAASPREARLPASSQLRLCLQRFEI